MGMCVHVCASERTMDNSNNTTTTTNNNNNEPGFFVTKRKHSDFIIYASKIL